MENKTIDFSTWNIAKKMLHVEHELEMVKKGLNVKLPQGSYKAVSEVDVLLAVKPLEFKYGIKSLPIRRSIVESKETLTKSGTVNQFMRLQTTFRFINIDTPADFIEIDVYGDGVDSQDKAPGKAMTYADKYALLKAYKIATGDDPDQEASQEHKESKCTDKQLEIILEKADKERIQKIIKHYEVPSLNELTLTQASQVIKRLND